MRIVTGLFVSLSFILSASAALPPYQTAEVMCVLMLEFGDGGAWQGLAARVQDHSGPNRGRVAPVGSIELGESGFGFAGSAAQSDIATLRFGYYLGLLPALKSAAKAEELTRVVGALEEHIGALADLQKPVREAALQALLAARGGKIDGAAYAETLRASGRVTASQRSRVHGYLMAGLWSGLSALSGLRGAEDRILSGMVWPLTSYLDEDAMSNGTDQTIAGLLREMAAALTAGDRRQEQLASLHRRLLAVGADR